MSVLDNLRDRAVDIRVLEPKRQRRTGLLRRNAPDVWLTQRPGGSLDVPEPVVAVVHGAAWPIEPSFFEYLPRTYADAMIAAVTATVANATLVIVPSEYARRGLVQGCDISPGDVYAVPHGVDIETFHPARTGGRGLVAAELGTAVPYVLFASIPTIRQKNLALLKTAMGMLAERARPHVLVIAGGVAGGESADELGAVVEEAPGMEGRVLWLGHVDDTQLAGLMAECAAFCLPSLFESFGLTALEAMACGAPVVVSDRGALPEVVGDAALTVEPTAPALATALERVIDDEGLGSRLRAAGRARAETMTWERTADGWLEVLQIAADGRTWTAGDLTARDAP
jgi:glycosyltransferase involved in cell wall biosynthesis